MAAPRSARTLMVGLVFLGSLVLLGWVTLSLDAVDDLPLLRSLLGAERHDFTVRFAKINNLRPGDDVLVNGFRIGQVKDIRYAADTNQIAVQCTVEQRLPLTDASFFIRSSSALGGHYVEIVRPPEKDEEKGKKGKKGKKEEKGEKGEKGEETEPKAKVYTGEAQSDFQQALSEVANTLREGEGLLPRLLTKKELADDFEQILDSLRQTTDELQKGEGLLYKLLTDRQMADDFGEGIKKFGEMTGELEAMVAGVKEKKGVLGLLLTDEEARARLENTLTNVEEFVEKINTGKGIIAELANNEEMAETLQGALDDVHDIVHKANHGVGTIGQAINNDQAWKELVRVLALAGEAIEDFREQAPISTFANVIFAGL